MNASPWAPLRAELDCWAAASLTARLWLRDDDAVANTPALSRLLATCRNAQAGLLLAIIPMRADASLQRALADEACVMPAMHGIWHQNHAPAPRKAEELAPERGQAEIMAGLATARLRLHAMFGAAALRCYVPPWNRIAPQVAAWLPEAGFVALSCFGRGTLVGDARLVALNTHVDIVDWKGGRIGRPAAWVAAELARQLAQARAAGAGPVGILTHHLAHDATAWSVLDGLLEATLGHAAARWIAPSDVVR